MHLRLLGDFNGLFGEILCLSHGDSATDAHGARVELYSGMLVEAVEEDRDEDGCRDDLLASGVVEPAPDWLQCNGSKWVLRIDGRGVRHESDG